jgi:hypothetical protein
VAFLKINLFHTQIEAQLVIKTNVERLQPLVADFNKMIEKYCPVATAENAEIETALQGYFNGTVNNHAINVDFFKTAHINFKYDQIKDATLREKFRTSNVNTISLYSGFLKFMRNGEALAFYQAGVIPSQEYCHKYWSAVQSIIYNIEDGLRVNQTCVDQKLPSVTGSLYEDFLKAAKGSNAGAMAKIVAGSPTLTTAISICDASIKSLTTSVNNCSKLKALQLETCVKTYVSLNKMFFCRLIFLKFHSQLIAPVNTKPIDDAKQAARSFAISIRTTYAKQIQDNVYKYIMIPCDICQCSPPSDEY